MAEDDGCSPKKAKHQKFDFYRAGQQSTISEKELMKLVASYVVDEMLPISTIDSSSFRKIQG